MQKPTKNCKDYVHRVRTGPGKPGKSWKMKPILECPGNFFEVLECPGKPFLFPFFFLRKNEPERSTEESSGSAVMPGASF